MGLRRFGDFFLFLQLVLLVIFFLFNSLAIRFFPIFFYNSGTDDEITQTSSSSTAVLIFRSTIIEKYIKKRISKELNKTISLVKPTEEGERNLQNVLISFYCNKF